MSNERACRLHSHNPDTLLSVNISLYVGLLQNPPYFQPNLNIDQTHIQGAMIVQTN